MEKRYQAQHIYINYRKEEDAPRPTRSILQSLFSILVEFLSLCKPEEKFSFHEFHKILNFSSSESDFDLTKASEAFETLEFFLITIWKNSWKPEFKRIRKYCGFYQTKIESHLKKSEEVFKLIGYVENGDTLVLNRRLNQDVVLSVGFECILASVECILVSRIRNRIETPKRPYEIFTLRQKYCGSEDEFVSLLAGSRKDAHAKTHSKLDDTEVDHNSVTFSPSEERPGHHDIPFIDDDADGHKEYDQISPNFEEGTLDDHLMASLKLVSKEKKKVEEPAPSPKKGSEEWSFVTDSLRKRYGEEYNWGQRGDILQAEQSTNHMMQQDVRKEKGEAMKRLMKKESSSYRDSGYVGGSSFQNVSHRSDMLSRAGCPETKMPSSYSKPIYQATTYAHAQLPPSCSGGNLVVSPEERDIGGGEKLQINDRVDVRFDRLAVNQPVISSHSAPIARKLSKGTEVVPAASSSRFGSRSLTECGWVCPYCTIRNPIANPICSVCSKTNDMRDTKVASKSMDVRWTSRQCAQCTYVNHSDRTDCEMCGNTLNDTYPAS